MPIKRLHSITPAKQSARLRTESGTVCLCPPQRSSFWIVFPFMLLFAAVFVIGTITMLLYRQQIGIVWLLNYMDGKVQQTEMTKESGAECQYRETQVKGLYLAYSACKPTFTGACDDAGLYRLAADGSKQVIIPSLRNLQNAPLSSDLLQPIAESVGGQYIVFGAWAYGTDRNPKDERVWIFDTLSGALLTKTDLPKDAVFSPDFTYAAYGILANNDIQEVMLINLKDGKTASAAKAKAHHTFMGLDHMAALSWKDAKTLVIKDFVTDMNVTAQEQGEIQVKVK